MVAEGAGGVEGYASYRVRSGWGALGPDNKIEVVETMAATPEAEAALWRYLFDVDLVTSVSAWGRPPDEPLQWMLADPRGLARSLADGVWLRLVDLPAALSGRRYRAQVAIVLEVADHFCPWNEGRWRVEGAPDGATCERTTAEPNVACTAAELGAAFLGGTPLEGLRRAGRLVEATPAAVRRAHAGFAWDPLPWGVTWF